MPDRCCGPCVRADGLIAAKICLSWSVAGWQDRLYFNIMLLREDLTVLKRQERVAEGQYWVPPELLAALAQDGELL